MSARPKQTPQLHHIPSLLDAHKIAAARCSSIFFRTKRMPTTTSKPGSLGLTCCFERTMDPP
eukprot:scaffold253567_cov26-Tisochrysis_lutea.AAC.1